MLRRYGADLIYNNLFAFIQPVAYMCKYIVIEILFSVSDHVLPIWTSLLREKVDQAPLGLGHTLRTMLADYDADALDALLDEH